MITRTKQILKTAGSAVAAMLTAAPLVLGGLMLAGPQTGVAAAALPKACSVSAGDMHRSCTNEAVQDWWNESAKCDNVSDPEERADCNEEKRAAYREDRSLCRAQRSERLDVCKDLGEAPYDPQIDPANFVNPLQIGKSVAPNPYLILTPGYTRIYEAEGERITITVTRKTIKLLGVTCVVVRDTARDLDGSLIEDTVDYFAQDLVGNVWYFGETTAEYEDGFPVSVDGSFKAGEERAKPGIAMQAVLPSGKLYREEFDLGNAEDLAEIITVTASESSPAASCNGTCLMTDNFTPITPEHSEKKFYAPGIGEIVAYPEDDPSHREVLVEYHY